MTRKRKCLYIIGVIILTISIIIIRYETKSPYTFELPETRTYIETGYIGDETLSIYLSCMSINPPHNDSDIIKLMLDYCRKNRESIESLGDYQTNMKVNIYTIRFYKETFKFRRTWKPKKPEETMEELTDYAKYLLGAVEYYSEGDDNVKIIIRKNNDILNDTEYTLKKSEVFK